MVIDILQYDARYTQRQNKQVYLHIPCGKFFCIYTAWHLFIDYQICLCAERVLYTEVTFRVFNAFMYFVFYVCYGFKFLLSYCVRSLFMVKFITL